MNEGFREDFGQGKYYSAIINLSFKERSLGEALKDIDSRLNEIEQKVFNKAKRLKAHKAQRTLILHHLGLLKEINLLPISKNNKALVLSVMIDSDTDVEKDMNKIAKKHPDIISEYNYKFLVDFFEKVGLEKQASECEKILTQIISEKENNKNIKKR